MIPKERSSWVSVPWMFQYTVNSYPPFGNHAKMGIDNLCLHPFTLLFVEVPVRTNDHHSIVVQIGFFGGLGTSIKYLKKNILCDGCSDAMDTGSSKPKDLQFFFLNLKIKDPKSFAAKIMVEYNSRAVS